MDVIQEVRDFLYNLEMKAGIRSAVMAVEKDVKEIGTETVNYIKTNGLQDVYTLATALLAGAATGTPWATLGATLVTQAESAGIALAKGAEAIVLGQAQTDLIAVGKLISPTSNAIVASITPSASPAPAA